MVAAVGLHGTVQPGSGMLLLISGSTLAPGNSLEGGGWSLAIKRKCQLLPYNGGRVEAIGLHGTVQPEAGMLLLTSASTLEPGNSPEGEGWSLAIKDKC